MEKRTVPIERGKEAAAVDALGWAVRPMLSGVVAGGRQLAFVALSQPGPTFQEIRFEFPGPDGNFDATVASCEAVRSLLLALPDRLPEAPAP